MQGKPLLDLGVKDLASGLFPGVHPAEVPLWVDALNVDFDGYGVHSSWGFTKPRLRTGLFDSGEGLFDDTPGFFDDGQVISVDLDTGLTVPITGLLAQYRTDTTRRIIYATGSNIYEYDGAAPTSKGSGYTNNADETPFRPATRWSLLNWGDWVVASNGIDAVQVRKTGNYEALANTPFTWAEIIFAYGPHILALNTSNGTNMLEWCAEDNIEAWDPETNASAGNLPIRGVSGPFICAVPLGEVWMAYTPVDVRMIRYVGGVFIFGEFPAMKGIGAVSKSSVVSIGRRNYGITREGIFVTDGASFDIITNPAFGQWLNKNINWGQKSKIAGYHDQLSSQIRWSFPTINSNEPDLVIGFNYITKAFSFYSIPFTVGLEKNVLDFSLIGTPGGKVVLAGSGFNGPDGEALTRYARTKPLDLGARALWKYIDLVQTMFEGEGATGLELRVGWQEKLTDEINWCTPIPIGELDETTFHAFSGVYITLEWRSSALDADFKISGVKVFGTPDGGVY